MKCFIDKDINKCPYFLPTEEKCTSKTKCSYQEQIEPNSEYRYLRKERWYEKYYKKS